MNARPMHCSPGHRVGWIRIVCNPRGYPEIPMTGARQDSDPRSDWARGLRLCDCAFVDCVIHRHQPTA